MQYLKSGDMFSGCRIVGFCGSGAFGSVYLAEDAAGRRVALKIIPLNSNGERELIGIRHYMKLNARQRNLLEIYHAGQTESVIYYLMEVADNLGDQAHYIPKTLANVLKVSGMLEPNEALEITRKLLDGLECLQEAGLIHCDIKPDNILFVNGEVKLSDPGLVRDSLQSVSFAGTLGFIPPECFVGKPVNNPGADLYAVGKVLYCMLTGLQPGQYPHLPRDMRMEVCRQVYPILNRVCNSNVSKRCKNIAEFRAGLPSKIAPPRCWERRLDDFRNWRLLNQRSFRRIQLGIFLSILLIAIAGLMIGCHLRNNARIMDEKRQIAQLVLDKVAEHDDRLFLQLEADFSTHKNRLDSLYREAKNAYETGKFIQSAVLSQQLEEELNTLAIGLIPPAYAGGTNLEAEFKWSGQAHGFLETPLSGYLRQSERDEFEKQLKKFDTTLFAGWKGPRFDRDWSSSEDLRIWLTFVPPGKFRSSVDGRIINIPYHYWMMKTEVTVDAYKSVNTSYNGWDRESRGPANQICWNDALEFFRKYTISQQKRGVLPPGYILRPPMEDEWEFAAIGGWRGNPEESLDEIAWYQGNSEGHTHTVSLKKPNRLGLYDMVGNVSELVFPTLWKYPVTGLVATRGGSFRDKAPTYKSRGHAFYFLGVARFVGIRGVMAPGDMNFFDTHFYTGIPCKAECNGMVYELLTSLAYAAYNRAAAGEFARLTGGKLAEFPEKQHFDELLRLLPTIGQGETFIGGHRDKDGMWRWDSSGLPVNWGAWNAQRDLSDTHTILTVTKKWTAVKPDTFSQLILIQWTPEEYRKSHEFIRTRPESPLIAKYFDIDGKKFILFKTRTYWYEAKRVCELLGGRLACLDDPALTRKVFKSLDEHKGIFIALGGYRKYEKWLWLNGEEETRPIKPSELSFPYHHLAYKNGALEDTHRFDGFLCELLPDAEINRDSSPDTPQ